MPDAGPLERTQREVIDVRSLCRTTNARFALVTRDSSESENGTYQVPGGTVYWEQVKA